MANAEVRVAIVGDNSDLQASLDQSQSKLASFGKAVGKVALAAGVAAAGGLALLGKASVEAASLAQQSIGATETVYGKYADTVVKQSNRAAQALGLSADEYRNNANVLGALLGNQGVAQDELAGKTRSLIKTGADLAATFGGDTATAVNALASAFKGEFDPLEQYGISIKQATVNTQAYALAGVKTKAAFDKLLPAQQAAYKQQATNNLITAQSSKAQGQFARETDTLAHQQQVLNAQWENLKVTIGNALLPAVTDFVKLLNRDVVPAVADLADKYLPKAQAALHDLFGGDPGKGASKLGDSLKGIDWQELGDGAADLASTAKELGPALADISAAGVNDTLKVFNVLVGFAADHIDTLRKVLPLIVAGFVALKAAQVLNTVAGRDSLIGLALQLTATYKLKQANQELVVVLREVQAAQGGITGTMGAAGGATQVAASKINRLQTAAKGAAGIAGLGAMAVGAGTTNDAVGTLVSTLGGAATGFAVGGPVGAAVGGLAGLFMGLASNTRDAGDAAKDTATDWAELADTLDQVTGAVTDQTRAQLYEKLASDGTLDTLAKLGVTRREVISAIQGQKGALSDLNGTLAEQQVKLGVEQGQLDQLYAARQRDQAAIAVGHTLSVKDAQALVERTHARDAEIASLEESTAATRTSIESTQGAIETIKEHRREILLRSRDTADYAGKLKGLPKEARTQIKADGVIPTTRAIAKLANKYNLTPKQIKTLIEATGTETTARKVAKVQAALRKVNDTKPDLTRFSTGTNKFMTDLAPKVKTSAGKVGKAAKEGVQQGAKGVNLNGYKSDVTQGVNKAKSAASTGGNQVGTALKTGTMAGVSGLMSQLSGAVAAAVNAAVAAGKRAARAKSPSKRMYELGEDIGDGLVLGVNSKKGAAAKAGKGLVDKLFGGGALSADDIVAGLGKVADLVNKSVSKAIKDDKAAKRHSDAILDSLRKRSKALRENAKAQRESNAELDRAQGVLDALRAKADAVRQSFVAFGDITQLGRLDNGKVSLTRLLAQLRQRAADAREFNTLIQRLAAMGLTQAQINQLVEAGPEQALATARAIASGGQAAVTEIRNLGVSIASSGGTLGTALADRFSEVSTAAAAAYVAQLKAKQDELDETARRMAKALVKQLHADLAGLPAKGGDGGKPKPKPKLSEGAKAGADRTQVSVKLSAQQVSQIERGRAVQLDLDAYRAAGGRARR